MDESNEFLVMTDPSSKSTASGVRSITSAYPDNRPAFEKVIAIYSDDGFQKVAHDMLALLYRNEFLISEVTDNIFGQGNL